MMRRNFMDRRALIASGAAAALLSASGVSAQLNPARGGRMRAALSGASREDRFDSRQAQGLFMQVAMVGAVFDTLTEIAADGTLRGELATQWNGSPDARNWTIDLRDDAIFHNGKTFQATDVEASFALHRDTILADVTRLEVVGAHKVTVELAIGDPDFPYRLSDPHLLIYPADAMAAAMRQGIGTGLYRVHRFQAGRQFLGHRVEHHYKDGRAGWFNEIEVVALSSDAVRAEALREHYVDVADLTHPEGLGDPDRFKMLPEQTFMNTAVDNCISVPPRTGSRWPMDNLRAAERWWMA